MWLFKRLSSRSCVHGIIHTGENHAMVVLVFFLAFYEPTLSSQRKKDEAAVSTDHGCLPPKNGGQIGPGSLGLVIGRAKAGFDLAAFSASGLSCEVTRPGSGQARQRQRGPRRVLSLLVPRPLVALQPLSFSRLILPLLRLGHTRKPQPPFYRTSDTPESCPAPP